MIAATAALCLFSFKVQCRSNRAGGFNQIISSFGNGLASFAHDLYFGDQESLNIESGKNVQMDVIVSDHRLKQNIMFILTYVCISIIIVGIILYFLKKQMKCVKKVDLKKVMQQKQKQRLKHYHALKIISQTGVHPDRASGSIYKIKL